MPTAGRITPTAARAAATIGRAGTCQSGRIATAGIPVVRAIVAGAGRGITLICIVTAATVPRSVTRRAIYSPATRGIIVIGYGAVSAVTAAVGAAVGGAGAVLRPRRRSGAVRLPTAGRITPTAARTAATSSRARTRQSGRTARIT